MKILYPSGIITVLALLVLAYPLGAIAPAHTTNAPQKIASATIASDEILFEILNRAKQAQRLAAVSYLADDPRYSNISAQVKTIPARVGLNSEALLSLKPDLVVLASFNRPELQRQLMQAKIPVHLLSAFNNLDDISQHIRGLGALLQEEKIAEEIAGQFSRDLARLREQVKSALAKKQGSSSPKLLYWSNNGIYLGSGTMFQSMVELLAGENEATRLGIKGWGRLSDERLATSQAEYLVVAGAESERDFVLKTLQTKAAFAHLPALKAKRIIMVPAAELEACSPYVVLALEKIAAGIIAEL
jgi:iron complex transport system substrate-binding protein